MWGGDISSGAAGFMGDLSAEPAGAGSATCHATCPLLAPLNQSLALQPERQGAAGLPGEASRWLAENAPKSLCSGLGQCRGSACVSSSLQGEELPLAQVLQDWALLGLGQLHTDLLEIT